MIRREFLKTGGALVVGFSLRDRLVAQERGTKPGPPDAKQDASDLIELCNELLSGAGEASGTAIARRNTSCTVTFLHW